jgi:hypothetical protein
MGFYPGVERTGIAKPRVIYYRKRPNRNDRKIQPSDKQPLWGWDSRQVCAHIAVIMGCSPVYLVGCEYEYRNACKYAWQADPTIQFPGKREVVHWVEGERRAGRNTPKGCYGPQCTGKTDYYLEASLCEWNQIHRANPKLAVIDLSGGQLKGVFEQRELKEVLGGAV